ncbi:hypothetical protein D3C75_650660 [compost metagenome]
MALCIGVWVGSVTLESKADGASAQTGTVSDPLITKSYLDQQLADLVAKEMAKQGSSSPATVTPAPSTGGTDTELKVVQLQTGQTLYAKAGTEVIVRTGKTVAVSTDGDGIPDVTSGKDLAAGSAIDLNHLLIFPRDGRGLKPAAKSEAAIYVMVRGGYSIQNADGTVLQ